MVTNHQILELLDRTCSPYAVVVQLPRSDLGEEHSISDATSGPVATTNPTNSISALPDGLISFVNKKDRVAGSGNYLLWIHEDTNALSFV